MELQGYQLYDSNTPREITTKDKLVFTHDGHERVITVLLTRRNNLICRREGEQGKFELYFTKWEQEDGLPMIHGGGQLTLWVLKDSPTDEAKPARAPRVKAAPGETKIAKCRAIYAANPTLDKEAMLAKFVAEAGCTPAGAVTYLITCKKG